MAQPNLTTEPEGGTVEWLGERSGWEHWARRLLCRSIDHQPIRFACCAPHVTLSFDMTGSVSVYAFTGANPLERVGDISLAEMWHGDRIRRLRDVLEHDDLGHACSMCAEEIAGGNLHGALAVGFDRFSAHRFPDWPKRMEFALSDRCNLRCVMCSGEFASAIRSRRKRLPALPDRYGEAFLEELDPFLDHLEQARFVGGESFLAEIDFRIWEWMIERGLRNHCNVTTNGKGWTPRVERVLEALPFSIGVSPDGVTRMTNEAISAGASYDRIMENLRRSADYSDRTGSSFNRTFCLMVANSHEFVDFLSTAGDLGCHVYVNTVRQPPEHSLFQLLTEDLRRVVERIEAAALVVSDRLIPNPAVLDERLDRSRRELHSRVVGAGDHERSVDRHGHAGSILAVVAVLTLIDVLAVRSGGGVVARVMSFSDVAVEPTVLLMMTRRTWGADEDTRCAILLEGGAAAQRPSAGAASAVDGLGGCDHPATPVEVSISPRGLSR